ncbi:unnamed protein product [Allacma fusca]|uniref:Uncharacterized protein n=1 Tax=Allacma fusca TaxID=39272 RepID=A0A8J2JLG7_9HEXA|nr:unnamed protein product [Allacma fusca]
MFHTCKGVLKESPSRLTVFYTWLPLVIWCLLLLVPLFVCVTLDVLMVLDMRLPWDSSRETCHPILSGLFFYTGLLLMYYHLRNKKAIEPCLRTCMIVAGMLFMSLYLIDIIFLSLWFVTLDSGTKMGLILFPVIYTPISCIYLRYFYKDLSHRIPEKLEGWNSQDFLQV